MKDAQIAEWEKHQAGALLNQGSLRGLPLGAHWTGCAHPFARAILDGLPPRVEVATMQPLIGGATISTMKKLVAYEIAPDRAGWSKMNGIEARHVTKLPGLHCPICGRWALTGVAYPTVDPATFPPGLLPKDSTPLTIDAFRALSAKLEPVIGTSRRIFPGVDFGPLKGKAKGEFADFAWVNPWTVLVRDTARELFERADVRLVVVPADLAFAGGVDERLLEIEAAPRANLATSVEREVCSTCGRTVVRENGERQIASSGFDDSIALQRVVEKPTILIANEAFARIVRDHNLRDIVLTPVVVR